MRAFLLAGGYGTRLKPLTDHVPKCLVEIQGKPLLGYWLEQLVGIGCKDILINTHYLHEKVEDFVEHSPYSQYVRTVHEPALLGTLGSIRANREFLCDDVNLIAHADNFCLTDWQSFVADFIQRPFEFHMSMMLFETQTPWSCGLVKINEHGILTEFLEKPAEAKTNPDAFGKLANAAVFLFDQDGIKSICDTDEEQSDLCRDFLPHQIGRAMTFLNTNVHIDIGTPKTYELAQMIANERFGPA